MSDALNTSSAQTDPLRLDRCPDCGYLLTGLPEQGMCPECGFQYNGQMIVLYGWLRRSAMQDWPPLMYLLFYGAAAGLLFALQALVRWAGLGSRRPLTSMIWAVAMVFMAVAHQYRKRRLAEEGLAGGRQLRVFPEGFAARMDCGPVKLQPWQPDTQHILKPRKNGIYRLKISSTGTWGSTEAAIEFKCRPEDADRLAQRIESYAEAAQRGVR